MVAAAPQLQKRLSVQVEDIAPDITTIRSLDWDRDRFDIEFGLQNGTTFAAINLPSSIAPTPSFGRFI